MWSAQARGEVVKIIEVAQGSPDWYLARLGIPTASEFSRLVTSKGAPSSSLEGYARELAAELFAGKTLDAFDGNVWMNRGKDMEIDAKDFYAFAHDATLTPVGFVTTDDGLAGCSPDALVGDDGLLEVKCLKAERHVEAVHYHGKHGKAPSGYVQQTQGQLLITGRKWVDLMFYSPELPPLVIRQTPDPEMHAALRAGIAAVIAERDSQLASLRRHQQELP